jgi:chemotaxis protein CheX
MMTTSNASLTSTAGRECWVATLQLAVKEVFELMLSCPLEVPAPPPAPLPPIDEKLDITAMVGLAGMLCGMLSVRCSSKSATQMASRMLGIDPDKAGPEVWDAMGEICNMVAGNFKNKISGLGDGCMLSVPTVITGGDYNLHSPINEEYRTVLLFEGQPLVISLEVHN